MEMHSNKCQIFNIYIKLDYYISPISLLCKPKVNLIIKILIKSINNTTFTIKYVMVQL